ncbi:hypothetical protein P9761_14885 [Brevibacillus centrosporus]|uniref:hypothetical protein n=1 Tax=Brevibacillus centrosporus TaxID=54910 RepID=UPI002E1D4EE9|nr:hypothetical protein [Brevibacillus centrosporus]
MKAAARLSAYVCLLSLFLLITGFSSPQEAPRKAVWLWHTSLVASEPDEILAFSKKQGVNLLYLQIDITKKPSYYQAFIRDARRDGIEVHALSGSPAWGLRANQQKVLAFVNWVHQYNQSVLEEEKISGVHVDIEPYLLPEWKSDQADVMSQWRENVKAYLDLAHEDPQLETGCDIPFWLDKYELPDLPDMTLSKWMIAQHDHVAIMSYRDRVDGPNSIASLVVQELGYADALGKKIMLGVETKESSEGNFVSFYEEGAAYLNQEITKLPILMAEHASYGGIAVHSYEYWKTLGE